VAKSITLSDVTTWLVANGYAKADGKKTKQGGFLYEGRGDRRWSFCKFANGKQYLNISPGEDEVPGHPGCTFNDMRVCMEIGDDDRVASVYVSQLYSGSAIGGTIRPPHTTTEVAQIIEEAKEVFVRFCDEVDAPEEGRSDAEIGQEVQEFFLQNPGALDFFCSPEVIDEEGSSNDE